MNRQVRACAVTLRLMSRIFVITWTCLLLASCSAQNVALMSDDPILRLETQRVFAIRLNVCGCIIDTPELNYEVKLGRRWRRVFLQPDESSMAAFQNFRSTLLRNPRSVSHIEANFTGVFYQWLQGHQAPGLQFLRTVESSQLPLQDKPSTP